MIAFIDAHRTVYGVEPICKVLPIAPSTYHAYAARRADPNKLPARAKRDEALKAEIRRVFETNFRVYGVRKVWHQLAREGIAVARCTVVRLMRAMGLEGAVRGKPVRTTISDRAVPCPLDRVNRQFRAPRPNALWVSDFTYVATWAGFVYVAFVIDTYARRIVGWRVSRTAQAGFVLDALEQALHERQPIRRAGLVHHSDRGGQYVSLRYTQRLAEAGIEPSVGSVGDSYDNALAETVIGLFKAEVVHRRGPWRSLEAVEYATLEWVDWFNHRRLLEPIGKCRRRKLRRATMNRRRDGREPTTAAHVASVDLPAVQNLLLAANALGYGSALMTLVTVAAAELRELVGLVDGIEPMAIVPIGRPARPLGAPRRISVGDKTYLDRYSPR